MYCLSNSFFVVKCVLVSLKVLDHSFIQWKKILLAMVDNLVTCIENENFKDFTLKDTKFCVYKCMCLCMCMEVCIDNKLVTQIGPPNKHF